MEQTEESKNAKTQNDQSNVSLPQVFASILACFYGVQSSKNRKRDFTHGKAKQFIIAGIVMTGVWYFSIYLIVSIVMHTAR
ncbi:Uncharacterised protein [Halioglobus japonicus]|nr:Uncharacterised protein [Halioglobus japonicus]